MTEAGLWEDADDDPFEICAAYYQNIVHMQPNKRDPGAGVASSDQWTQRTISMFIGWVIIRNAKYPGPSWHGHGNS